jgi:hypothetical protein
VGKRAEKPNLIGYSAWRSAIEESALRRGHRSIKIHPLNSISFGGRQGLKTPVEWLPDMPQWDEVPLL